MIAKHCEESATGLRRKLFPRYTGNTRDSVFRLKPAQSQLELAKVGVNGCFLLQSAQRIM